MSSFTYTQTLIFFLRFSANWSFTRCSEYLAVFVSNCMLHLPGFCAVIRVTRVWMKKQSGNAAATIVPSFPAAVATGVTTCKDRNNVTDTSGLTGLHTDGQTDRHKLGHLSEGVKVAAQASACSVIQARGRVDQDLSGSRLKCEIYQHRLMPYC